MTSRRVPLLTRIRRGSGHQRIWRCAIAAPMVLGTLLVMGGTTYGTTPALAAATWTNVTPPGGDSTFYGACISPTTCIAGSARYNVYRTTNGGTSWSSTPAPDQFQSIACPSSTVCQALGYTTFYGSQDGGVTFTPEGAAPRFLHVVACPSVTICYATDDQGVWKTSDGMTWSQVLAVGTFGLACTDTLTCYAGLGGSAVDKTTDGGATWTTETVPGANNVLDIACRGATTCYATDGNSDNIWKSTDGATWAVVSSISAGPISLACPTATTCFDLSDNFNVYETVDGGMNWTLSFNGSSIGDQGDNLSCPTITSCYAFGLFHVYAMTATASTTTTTLTSSANPSTVNQPVTYTATVSPTPDGGTVAFTDGGNSISGCSAVPASTSTGQATCMVTYSSTGSHSIVASYSGDSTFSGSTSSTLTQTVNPAPVDLTTTLTITPNPVAPGGLVHVHATVTNNGSTSEQVTLKYTITLPNGTIVMPYGMPPRPVTIGAGKTFTWNSTIRVPKKTPPGTYTLTSTATDATGSSSATTSETVS